MLILVTASSKDNVKVINREMSTDAALKLVRTAIMSLETMEETSCDLKALHIINEVTAGNPKVIENTKNNHKLVLRRI